MKRRISRRDFLKRGAAWTLAGGIFIPQKLSAAVGSWNGVAFTAWNGIAQTAWNGTGISCASGGASVAIDTTAKDGGTLLPNTSLTFDIAVATNSNKCLLVFGGAGDATAAERVITGVSSSLDDALTAVPSSSIASSDWVTASAWYKVNPTVGTHTITITYTNVVDQGDGFALSLYNVNQSTPFGTAVTATGISTTATGSATLASTEMLCACICTDAAALTNTVGTRKQYDANVGSDTTFEMGTNTGTGSIAYTSTLSSDDWVWCGVPVKSA